MQYYNSYKKDCTRNFILNYNAVQSNMNKFKMVKLSIVPQYNKMLDHRLVYMNYKRIYEQLIERSRHENRQKHQGIYYEEHHIIPRCIGGTNDPENLVLFTGREHFIAHWLLTKIYPNESKIIFAFNSFSMKLHGVYNMSGQLDKYNTSKNYEYARQKIVKLLRGKPCSQKVKNILFDTTYINNGVKNKRIKKQDLQQYIDNGWIKGRIKYKRKPHSLKTRIKISQSNKGRKAPQGSIDFFKNKCYN